MSDCYVGVKACGCWVSAIVLHPEKPEWAKEVSRFVADQKRARRQVITAQTEDVRKKLGCEHPRKRTGEQRP